MWIAKGTLLGFWLFGFGTMAWLYFALYRNLRPNSAVSISVFSGLTTANPYWWAALALCLVLGLAIARQVLFADIFFVSIEELLELFVFLPKFRGRRKI